MITLRPDQQQAVDDLRRSLRTNRRVVLCAPTGFGKSQVAAFMAKGALAKGLRTWITVHRNYLIEQTSATLAAHGVDHGFIASGREFNPYRPVQVVSIDTLRHRLDRLTPPDLLIPDECHHSPSATWAKVMAWTAKAKVVGLSATPMRLDGRGLDDQFDDLVCGPTVAWLIERGHLSRYRAFAPSAPDMTGVHSRAGDYVTSDLEKIMDGEAIVGDLVRYYRELADGLRALYFGVSIIHSQHIAATFRAAGIPAVHIDGTTPLNERIKAARDMAAGTVKVISNVSLISEGYDLAAQAVQPVTVEAVGLARPTQSVALYLQAVGRALRPKPDPAIILDHAGCVLKHGLPDDDREWTLSGDDRRRTRSAVLVPPIRQCRECFAVFSPREACPYCGVIVEASPREVTEVAVDMAEVNRQVLQAQRKGEQRAAKSLEDLQAIAAARGYAPGWARHVWEARQAKRAHGAPGGLREALRASVEAV